MLHVPNPDKWLDEWRKIFAMHINVISNHILSTAKIQPCLDKCLNLGKDMEIRMIFVPSVWLESYMTHAYLFV